LMFGKADLTMALNGGIAGLVAITAGPNVPSLLVASVIGAVGGVLVVFSIIGLDKLKLDDPVGAISAHGTAGIWGVLAVPLWSADASFGPQIIGILTIFIWTFVVSMILWLVLKATMGIRVSEEDEMTGLDVVECGVEAYPDFTRAQ